ncbi:hypothetical protein SGPA1_10293 [Streptomyces misionensis JCM 4497]
MGEHCPEPIQARRSPACPWSLPSHDRHSAATRHPDTAKPSSARELAGVPSAHAEQHTCPRAPPHPAHALASVRRGGRRRPPGRVPHPGRRPGRATPRERARLLLRPRRPRVRVGGHGPRRGRRRPHRPGRRRHRPPGRTRPRGPQGARHHGRQPVLLLLRARQREPGQDVRRRRRHRPDAAVLRQLLRAPRLRRDRRRPRRHQPLRRLRRRRRPVGRPVREGRDRLAGRPRHGVHQPHRHPDRQSDLVERPDRHDRQELGRHHRQRRRRHRRPGPADHRADQRHLLLVRLLLRPGRPALRRRPRRPRRLRRERRGAGALRRRTEEARRRQPAQRRLDPAVDRAGLRQGRGQGARQRVRGPGHAGPQRAHQALRPVVGRAGGPRRQAQAVALPDRPRRPVRLPARRLGGHPAPLVRPRTPRLPQRHRPRADGRHRTPPRPVGHLRHLAARRHPRHHPAPGSRHPPRRRHPRHTPGHRHRDLHRRPAAERDRLGRAHRRDHPTEGRFRHGAPRPRPALVRLLPGHGHRHVVHRLRPPVRGPGGRRPGHHPRLLRRRRGHHHTEEPHLLGREHGRGQRLLPGDRGEDGRRRLHGVQPRLGRPRPPRLARRGRPAHPGQALHHDPLAGRHRPCDPQGPPARPDRRGHGPRPHRPTGHQADDHGPAGRHLRPAAAGGRGTGLRPGHLRRDDDPRAGTAEGAARTEPGRPPPGRLTAPLHPGAGPHRRRGSRAPARFSRPRPAPDRPPPGHSPRPPSPPRRRGRTSAPRSARRAAPPAPAVPRPGTAAAPPGGPGPAPPRSPAAPARTGR